jgi:UDP-xylose/UDP-N-acetylglucosamine transporter B4
MYERYGRPDLTAPTPAPREPNAVGNGKHSAPLGGSKQAPSQTGWQESMFYLHFLALPMFYFVRNDLVSQFHAINSGPMLNLSTSSIPPQKFPIDPTFLQKLPELDVQIPAAYLPLLLNTVTQLLCVAGVHRLTTAVSSLSVTLVLVVRKAVSLVLSVLVVRAGAAGDLRMMWFGACLVLLGTIGYSLGNGTGRAAKNIANNGKRRMGRTRNFKGRRKNKLE